MASTWRCKILTLGLLFIVNLLGQASLGLINWQAPLIMPGFTPVRSRPGCSLHAGLLLAPGHGLAHGGFFTT